MASFDPGLLAAVAAPVVVFDCDECVLYCNGPHAALIGRAGGELAGRTASELLGPAGVAALRRARERLAAGADEATLELEWRTEDGGGVRSSGVARLARAAGASLVVTSTPAACEGGTLATVLDFVPFGLLVHERDGTLKFNRRAEEILGISLTADGGSEQYLPLLRRIDGNSSTRDGLPSARVLFRGEVVAAEEFEVCRPDGARARILKSAGSIRGPEGDVRRSVVMLEDITAEAALRSSSAAYAGIVALTDDAIVGADAQQRIVLFNASAERIFGWSTQQAIGQPLDILLAPRVRARHRALVEVFARGPTTARRMARGPLDVVGLRKSGEEFPAEATVSRFQIDGAALLAVVVRDISEYRRRENEQRFLAHVGATLASSLDYEVTLSTVARMAVPVLADCCVVDLLVEDVVRRLRVVHVDPAKASLAAELETMEIRDLGSHLIWQTLSERRSVLLPNIPPGYLEQIAQDAAHLRMLRELAPVSLISVPLIARERVLGALTFVSVRPERVFGEPDLRLAEELARRAAMAMDNAQLYVLSQQASRTRDEILGVVAHDLRNPLTVIKMAADGFVRVMELPDKLSAALDRISRAAGHANRLIQDLLDIARIEGRGGLGLERRIYQPADLLAEASAMMQPTAEGAAITLSVDPPGELPAIEVDRDRILQVFSNLVGNAVKFTPSGGHIRLRAHRRGNAVCFAVADTGPGIEPEHLAHVFDRFWQAWSADRRGVGLGLAIVKGIVEAHGGRAWAESSPGEGSTFFFTVPAARSSPPGDHAQS